MNVQSGILLVVSLTLAVCCFLSLQVRDMVNIQRDLLMEVKAMNNGAGEATTAPTVTQEANPTINVTPESSPARTTHISPSEAAESAGVHYDTLHSYLKAGRIIGATQDPDTGRWSIPRDFEIMPKSG